MINSLRVAWFVTLRKIRRGQRGIIITPIIVMGVTYINLLFIPGIIKGAIQANNQKLRETLVADYAIQPSASDSSIRSTTQKEDAIRQLPGVEAVTSTLQVGNRITNNGRGGYWTVLAIEPTTYSQVFKDRIQVGSFLSNDSDNSIVLGSQIAGAESGNGIASLGSISTDSTVNVLLYASGETQLKVKGIFNDSFYDADVRAFISRSFYQTLEPDSVNLASRIFIRSNGGTLSAETLQKVQEIVGSAEILSKNQASAQFEEQAGTYGEIGRIISSMAVVVVAIIVFIVTYIDLVQRRRQLGIQRAIGVSRSAIVYSYIMKAVLTTLIGVLVGYLLYRFIIVSYFNKYPFILRNGEVTLVTTNVQYMGYAVFLLAVSIFAALLPAVKEVRIRILNAIWSNN